MTILPIMNIVTFPLCMLMFKNHFYQMANIDMCVYIGMPDIKLE